MKNRIVALVLAISLLCTSLLAPAAVPDTQAAFPPTPPTGWTLGTTFQKVPLSMEGTTYYAFELKKSTASAAGGWLVTNADGTIVRDRETYKKLALTATVSRVVQDPAFLPQMKNELEVLKGIRWRIELYETATGLTKLGADLVAILKGKPAMGGLEDVAATLLTPTEITEGNRIHDALWPLFTGGLVNNLSPSITTALSLLGSVGDSSEQWLKVFGIVGTVLRKTVAAFAQGGATTYQGAFTLANETRSSWSYEDASLFLQKYEEGRTHGLPFATWYITLIPHEGGFFGSIQNIGEMWWENIIKEVIPSTAAAAVDGMKLSADLVNRFLSGTPFTDGISADITRAAAIFALYRLYYDPATKGSLAEQISRTEGERILSFDSTVTVREDSTLLVQETIRVVSQGLTIQHGIYRDFPTTYTDPGSGRVTRVAFDVVGVERDGAPEPWHSARQSNGVRIYFGSSSADLEPGEHTYVFTYTSDRQLGFFATHDELYWNVTGNGWQYPIDGASCTVILPGTAWQEISGLTAYTGTEGATGADFVVSRDAAGNPVFSAVRPLEPGEGLSIVVGWAKGFVQPPTALLSWSLGCSWT